MTIVAAIVTPEGAWMGSDSLASNGDSCITTTSTKMGRFANHLVGFSGDWRLGRMVLQRYSMNPTAPFESMYDGLKFEKSDWDGFDLLVVENGRIYEVSSGGILAMPVVDGCTYGAIGSGSQVAFGSLYGDAQDESSLMQALEASAFHTPGVRAPFSMISLNP